MKKIIFLLVLTASFIACGGDKDLPVIIEDLDIPSLSKPANNQLCLDIDLEFSWTVPPDIRDIIINYQIQISKDINFSKIEYTYTGTSTHISFSLEKGTAYYWRVRAISDNSSSPYSGVYKFYTRGDGIKNTAPFRADVVSPAIDSVVQTNKVILEWDVVDADGDFLIYDIYFGTVNPPEKITSNQSSKTYEVTLESSQDYFWQIIARDSHGAESTSPIWRFKTD